MNKGIRLIRRVVALLLVLLLSIESFGAVVSDNDGSAFITKAEFDSLKNNFQSQINQYNTSIDSKIDGAIASYLAGVNIKKEEIKPTIFKDWNEYTMINGSFNNEFKLPKMDLNYVWSHSASFNAGGLYHLMGYLHDNFKNATKNKMKRNVITAFRKDGSGLSAEEYGLDPNNVRFVWKGYASDWVEEIVGLVRYYTTGDFSQIATSNFKIRFTDGFSFSIDNGYHALLPELYSVWKPGLYWYKNIGSTWIKATPTASFASYTWLCSANEFTYEHIGNFRDDSIWEVCLPAWQNTFYNSPNTTVTSATIKSEITQNSRGGYVKDYIGGSSYTEVWMPNNLNGEFVNSSTVGGSELNVPLPSVGMAGNLSCSYIQQTSDKIDYEFDKKNYTTNPYLLHEGFPLFYATDETEVTWEPVFNELYGAGLDPNGEINIVLAYKTFGNGIACNNCYITREGDTSATNMIWTTNNKTAKIKFKMPADGWVVAKWWPASLTPEQAAGNNFWYVTLDNKQSNKVIFVAAD